MPFVFWVLVSVFLVILFSGAYIFYKACVRQKELPWMVEEELKKTSFGKYYRCIQESDAWLKSHQAKDVYVQSRDGLKLHGFWIPAQKPRGTVLLAHGYRSTPLVDFGLAFVFYHSLGMNILVPQQRAHGESEGKFITFGVRESEDMVCWIEYHNKNFGDSQLILSGMSMGASSVLYMADMDLPSNVKCIIADCGFTSPWDILDHIFRKVTHLPSTLSLLAADLFARVFAGFSLKEKNTKQILKHARLPVLMIHGTDDDFVPSVMTQQGYDACTGPKELMMIPKAGHGVSFLVDRETYVRGVLSFLEKYLEDF